MYQAVVKTTRFPVLLVPFAHHMRTLTAIVYRAFLPDDPYLSM